jgi:hypothetical protein
MLPAGGALVLASTACAQIAREPRGRVPAEHQPAHIGGQLRVRYRDAATLCDRGRAGLRGPSTTAGACGAGCCRQLALRARASCGLAAAGLEVWPACGASGAHPARTTYGLAQIPGLGTAGRFCHHLRERQTAGLVVRRLCNGYAVPAG